MRQNKGILCILTYTCASRQSGVQFFDIGTSKNAPELMYFVHFHFKMCFSPQRRAFFLTSELQKVVRDHHLCNILTWKCASRHSGMQFFDIGTAKKRSGADMFCTFSFEVCFSPQRRAFFLTSELQKVVRDPNFFNTLTWK